jgi:hypothetical protein
MLHAARFALVAGLSAAVPMLFALDPPHRHDHNKQESKDGNSKAEPAKAESPKESSASSTGERIDRHNSRMKERNREIDSMLNKQKK